MACDGCCGPKDLTGASPGYRRALALVVALNLGCGTVEMAAGFLGRSQALKADALDFIGDGLITLLAFVALSRGPVWRARAALVQGAFLALLGVGVILSSVYRMFVAGAPDPETMGLMGGIALAANLASAALLVRYRNGDASARAVWLFSRNDALGNVGVILAGGLVAWTGTVWPDPAAALIIAVLFEWSALEIIRAARTELSPALTAEPSGR